MDILFSKAYIKILKVIAFILSIEFTVTLNIPVFSIFYLFFVALIGLELAIQTKRPRTHRDLLASAFLSAKIKDVCHHA